MDPSAVGYLEYLASTLGTNPEAQALTRQAAVHLSKYWWCELAIDILKLLRLYEPICRYHAYNIHQHVLLSVRDRLSPMMYVKILYLTLFHADAEHPAPDGSIVVENRLEMLDGGQACVSSITPGEATTYVLTQAMQCLKCLRALLLMEPGDSSDARLLIRQITNEVDAQPSHELQPLLLALLERARMREYELTYRYTDYYKACFSMVLFSEAAGLPMKRDEVARIAYKAVVAALLSDDVYNFGRLLNFTPFVACLEGTEHVAWLLDWARICNRGDVAAFEAFIANHTQDIASIPDIAQALATHSLPRKVRLIALLHEVYYAPTDARVFSYATIAQRCRLADELDVEPLLMTALAQGILAGTIDGVRDEVTVTSVQPRVLQRSEVAELAAQVTKWRVQVEAIAHEAADSAKGLAN